ncbi:MAG: glycosyltransferase family 2 protein [Lysobacterales bacterium]
MVATAAETLTEVASANAIAAIVVTYRSADTLDKCLTRLREARDVSEIVVVDNASDDGSAAIAQVQAEADPRVTVLVNSANSGFGRACNQAVRLSGSPWVAFVNPDCWVEPESLARMREYLDAPARAGIIGADLVDVEGVRDASARRCEPTLARMLAGAGRRASVATPADDAVAVQAVDAISGALMLMPRTLFESLSGFDEGYRLHAEDLDLCRRVRDAGRGVWVANDVRVVHVRGVSSRTRPWFVEWHKHRGMWRYFRKFEGRSAKPFKRAVAFLAIWSHFLLAAPHAVLRAQRR